MKNKIIGIIGAGDIGFCLAEILALQGYNIIVYNRYHAVDGKPSPYWLSKMGTVMDMNDSLQLPTSGTVTLTSDLNDLATASVVVITAGAKRASVDETRAELAGKNAVIMQGFAEFISAHPQILTLIVSNPVDFLTQYLITQIAASGTQDLVQLATRIVGVSYIDTMRLKNLVKDFIASKNKDKTTQPNVQAVALGEHGPTMVPLMSGVKVNGEALSNLATAEEIDKIAEQTILRGNDIIKLTGASSVLGPAHAAMYMINSIYQNDNVLIPCSLFDGKRAIGKMARFTAGYVSKVVDIDMNEVEKERMQHSEDALDEQYRAIISNL